MEEAWQVTVWGARGSFPRPSPDCAEYGGNTVCTALELQGRIVVLDAGTGLAQLGRSLTARRDISRLDILLSHFHMDHIWGLYSFPPLFNPDMDIHLYGGAGLRQYLETIIGPPYWPLPIGEFPARPVLHEIQAGADFDLDGLSVSTMPGNHPGGSILYRLEGAGKRLTCALDCETDEKNLSALAGFAQGSDLLIWDASFTRPDLRPGWGHSTWEQGLELGRAAGAGQVLMTHYSPDYTDEFLHRQERQAGQDGLCRFAKEGLVIEL